MFFDIEIWGFVREKSQAIFEKQLSTISKFHKNWILILWVVIKILAKFKMTK